jgi:SPX domain protein involved in polyphosphate accumulation
MAPNTERARADAPPALRYERKFRVEGHHRSLVELALQRHPAIFREIYHQRSVHSIYFDTHDLRMYFHNVDGEAERDKVRVRWYGERDGEPQVTLERKRKFGLVGSKDSFALGALAVGPGVRGGALSAALESDRVPAALRALCGGLRPVVLVSYRRRYLLSADARFRATIDDQLRFVRLDAGVCTYARMARDDAVILELKYATDDDSDGAAVAAALPFRVTRNSKYVVGVDKLFTIGS